MTKEKKPSYEEPSVKCRGIKRIDFHNKKITQQSFYEGFNTFLNASSWEDVPDFAIITGQNGAGKSILLRYINEKYGRTSSWFKNDGPFNIFYLESDAYSIDSGLSKTNQLHNTFSQLTNFDYAIQHLKSIFQDEVSDSSELDSNLKLAYEKLSQFKQAGGSITEEKIREILVKTIDYDTDSGWMRSPISSILHAEKVYKERINQLVKIYDDLRNVGEIYNYYIKKYNAITLEDFVKEINNEKFKLKVLEDYAKDLMGPSPIQIINQILKKYGFKYVLECAYTNREEILLREGDTVIQHNYLSSGEKMFIRILSWLFSFRGMSDSTDISKKRVNMTVQVMLLDEPDKHLDPKLCRKFYEIVHEEFVKKHGVQVIMTSHRLDTVILAPQNSIYMIQEAAGTKRLGVVRVHKLNALFRMSSNLRELINYHHKVYTESTTDAYFYEGAYSSLRALYSVRGLTGDSRYVSVNGNKRRKLSNRYQLSFYSVSTMEKHGGGCAKVINTVKTEMNATRALTKATPSNRRSRWFTSKKIFTDSCFHQPYGILDNDYGINHKLGELNKYLSVLTLRHSIENFLLDPIVVCSVLDVSDLEAAINQIDFNSVKDGLIRFKAICLKLHGALGGHSIDVKAFQTDLNLYFELYFTVTLKRENGFMLYAASKQPKKQEDVVKFKLLKQVEDRVDENGRFEFQDNMIQIGFIDVTDEKNFIILEYPEEFLKLQGHFIEKFWGKEKKSQGAFTDQIAHLVYEKGIGYIPHDLADSFFDLNDKVRAIVKPVVSGKM